MVEQIAMEVVYRRTNDAAVSKNAQMIIGKSETSAKVW